MGALTFLIVGLAVYRVTRLIIADKITQPLRERTVDKLPEASKLRELFHCPFCISIYVAFFAFGCWELNATATLWVSTPLALAAVTGLIFRSIDF